MKGLLIKDLRFTMQQTKLFGIIMMMYILFFITQGMESAAFVISYSSLTGGLFALNTISYDDYENSCAFVMTLPITRKDYVREKYIFGLLGILAMWTTSAVVYLLLYASAASEIFFMAVLALMVIIVFELLMLPIQLKFGGEKGRIALMGIAAALVLMVLGGRELFGWLAQNHPQIGKAFIEMITQITTEKTWVAWVVAGVLLLVGAMLSYRISVKIVEKKEY